MSEIKEGDLVTRVWPSGNKTMGRAVFRKGWDGFAFYSLEEYQQEGAVDKNDWYGMPIKDHPSGMTHHKATPEEIEDWENGCQKNRTLTALRQ